MLTNLIAWAALGISVIAFFRAKEGPCDLDGPEGFPGPAGLTGERGPAGRRGATGRKGKDAVIDMDELTASVAAALKKK